MIMGINSGDGIILKFRYWAYFKDLTDEEAGKFIKDILEYGATGKYVSEKSLEERFNKIFHIHEKANEINVKIEQPEEPIEEQKNVSTPNWLTVWNNYIRNASNE